MSDENPTEQPSAAEEQSKLPPADLNFLIGTLYIQGAMSLGLLANPMTQKMAVDLDRAKHAIDLLTVLQEKTEGNRTQTETEAIETALHELRMAFVRE